MVDYEEDQTKTLFLSNEYQHLCELTLVQAPQQLCLYLLCDLLMLKYGNEQRNKLFYCEITFLFVTQNPYLLQYDPTFLPIYFHS